MDQLADFRAAFECRLGMSRRWEAFTVIADTLLAKDRPVHILETGTARFRDNWEGDGQSTLVWDYILRVAGGSGCSVDSDSGACANARSQVQRMAIINADSIRLLAGSGMGTNTDLLYLDSLDWSHDQQAASCLHHAGELACVWHKLPSGCLIAVDDCFSDDEGKHLLVSAFFRLKKISPLVSAYVHVWVKP